MQFVIIFMHFTCLLTTNWHEESPTEKLHKPLIIFLKSTWQYGNMLRGMVLANFIVYYAYFIVIKYKF